MQPLGDCGKTQGGVQMRINSQPKGRFQMNGGIMGTGQGWNQNTSTAVTGTLSITKKENNSAFRAQNGKKEIPRKKLSYNPREVRNALLRACTSQSAGTVLTTAKSKLGNLLKCKGTGQYEESQLNAAILHAKRMVRCAQMKVRNLQSEEQMQTRIEQEVKKEKQKRVLKKRQIAAREKMRQVELSHRRRSNRNQEKSEMNEADSEYEKRQMQGSHSETTSFHTSTYATSDFLVEISKDGAKLSEEQLEALLPEAAMGITEGLDIPTGGVTDVPVSPSPAPVGGL